MDEVMSHSDDLFCLPEEKLYDLASERIVRRGLAYARAGRVTDIVQGISRVEASVQGSYAEPYLVSLEHDGEEILSYCTCPFDWEPLCKHAVALLAVQSGLVDEKRRPKHTPLEEEELKVRRQRGEREGFRIKAREGDGFFGIFDVRSPSGRSYVVEIRSLTERFNRCSCLDFATAMLGTCKHIEAVMLASKKRSKKKFEQAAKNPPLVAQVLVEQLDMPRIRLHLPARPSPALLRLAHRYFDADGYFDRDPVDGFSEFLMEAKQVRNLVIYGDTLEYSQRVADQRRAESRRESVQKTVLGYGPRLPGISATLYPYQVAGSAFLASRGRALLGDDMGLGKTVQAIAGARVLWERDEVRRILVVCPASLKHQWATEIARFSDLGCQVVGGPVSTRLAQYRHRAPFTIINYELVLRDAIKLNELEPQLLILDEAQRIRNWRTKTAEAIKAIDTPFAFVLTGTPLQNRLDDLYSIMQVVDRRILGPLWAYNERFILREAGRNRITGYKNLDELRRRLEPVVLRREKEEVKIQLPQRISSRLSVELTETQRGIMDEAVARAARLSSTAERRPLSLEEQQWLMQAMQQARMACNAAGLVDKQSASSPKLDEFEHLVRELCIERGRKVVVFSEWETFCRMAAQRADQLGIGHVRLHGGVPSQKRGGLIDRFRDDPECKLFFSTDAGGVGLNLQFASTMINLELPWNPAVLDQRIGRLHRHGQHSPVHVLMLVAEDSFETGIERTLRSKRSLFDAALSPRADQDTVAGPSSCLSIVRSALEVLKVESGQEEALPKEVEDPPREPPLDPARKIAGLLGSRLRKVLVLPSGKLVAVVDRLDATTRSAGDQIDATLIDGGMLDGLAALGEDSPFHRAQLVLSRPDNDQALQDQRRQEHFIVAHRRLRAARVLAADDLGAEALAQAHAAVTSMLKGLAVDGTDGDDGSELPSTRLLYELLVPRGRVDLEQAARVVRVESLARNYAESTAKVAADLLRSVLEDVEALERDLLKT